AETRRSGLDVAASLQRPAQGQLVGILEVSANRETTGDPGYLDPERPQKAGEIHRGGIALDVGVGTENDLGDALDVQPGQQLTDTQLLRADAFERGDGTLQHVIAAPVLTRL